MARIRIATRQSKLALWQANFISEQLRATHAGLEVEIVGMTTAGDRWLDKPLNEDGGKGLFIKELEAAMLAGDADIAVHSMKDLPAVLPDGFELGAIGYRAAVCDTLIGAPSLAALAPGAKVGSSSLRRQAQLLKVRPDLNVAPVRGNVGTRLDKLTAGEYDAIVLAQAGLDRLELTVGEHAQIPLDVSLPAAGQGALGIECLAGSDTAALVHALNDPLVSTCVQAERGVSEGLGADCSAPLAAYATQQNGTISLTARLGAPDGSRMLEAHGVGDEPHELAAQVVRELREQGAEQILALLH